MKKILLLSIELNGYTRSIKESLEKKGCEVTVFEKFSKIPKCELSFYERILRSLVTDFKLSFLNRIYEKNVEKHYNGYIMELKSEYDFVFDLVAQTNYIMVDLLKGKYPKAKFILYLWDDLEYQKNALKIYKKYDEVYSYNPEDVEKYGFRFRSNFYCKEFDYQQEKKEYGIFYVGLLRDQKRIDITVELNRIFKDFQNKILLLAKNSLKNKKKFRKFDKLEKNLIELPLQMKEIAQYSKKSFVLLDITYKNQKGLSLRPIEAIGANSKLITTNKNIEKYDFFNNDNIFVTDFENYDEEKLKEFIKRPFIEYSLEIKKKYSVEGFLEDIFKC